MNYQQKKDQVWQKAKKVKGKNPDLYRRDSNGNELYYSSYGKNTEKGWEIDHSKPVSKGGTDHLNNLNALKTSDNRAKSDKY